MISLITCKPAPTVSTFAGQSACFHQAWYSQLDSHKLEETSGANYYQIVMEIGALELELGHVYDTLLLQLWSPRFVE